MIHINPYLTFNGNCREAMTFYKECLGGELTLHTVGESPMREQWPANVQQNILHASLVSGPLILLGSDVGSSDNLVDGNTISLSLNCSSGDVLKTCFAKLSEGSRVSRPLHDFFAGTTGALTDKYGKNWLFYCEKK